MPRLTLNKGRQLAPRNEMNLEELITDLSNRRKVIALQIIILLTSTVPVLVMGYQRYDDQKKNADTAVFSQEEAAAQVVGLTVKEKFKNLERIGVSLSTRVQFRNDIKEGNWNLAIQKLMSVTHDFEEIDRIVLVNPSGTLMAEYPALGGVLGMDFSYRDWYKGVTKDWEPYVSDVYTRIAEPKIDVVAVAVPIKDDSGEILGILVMQMKAESVFLWAKDFAYNKSGEWVYFVDRNGYVIGQMQQGGVDLGSFVDFSVNDEVIRGKRGTRVVNSLKDSKDYVMSYQPIEEYGWGIVSLHPVEQAYSRHIQTLRGLLITIGLILSLNTVLAFFVMYMVHVFQDSLSREAGERLKKTLSLLEATLESTAEGILVMTDGNRVVRYNDQFLKMWKVSEDVLGQNDELALLKYMSKQFSDPEFFMAKILEMEKKSMENSFDVVELVDGRIFERYSRPQMLKDQAVGRVWSFKDITDAEQIRRKLSKSNDDLAKSQENLMKVIDEQRELKEKIEMEKNQDEAVINSIGDGLAVTDNLGKIVKANKAFEKLLGWSEEEVVGKELVDVMIRQDEKGRQVPVEERSISKVLAGADTIYSSLVNSPYYVRKDGTRFPATGVTTPVRFKNQILGAVIVFRDVTEDKAIDKAKTDFVSVASHQLRTPLSTIKWYSEYLLSGNKNANPEQQEYLEEIFKSVNKMVLLVNTLLNVSKIELGTFAIVSTPVDIVDLIHDVLKNFKRDMDMKKIAFDLKCDVGSLMADTDPNAITMIVQNLLSNAVTYTPEGGRIGVAVDKINGEIELKVMDNGYGIPDKDKPMIFTKMYRAENVKDKVPDGNGIGLYIAKAVVEKLGGSIRFESKENIGTTFFVEIPLKSKYSASSVLRDSRVEV